MEQKESSNSNNKRKEHPTKERPPKKAKTDTKPKKPKLKPLPMHVKLVKDPERFDARDSKQVTGGLEFLRKHGYVVMSHAADPEQVHVLLGLFWDYLEEMNPAIQRNDPKTWENKNWPGIFSVGILQYYGIGQSKFLWAVRTLPRLRAIFREIFQTNHLSTSLDGGGVFRGAEHKFDPNRSWLHVDQNLRLLPNLGTSIQGALNLVDATNPADSGSFLCLPGSHLVMKERFVKGEEKQLFASSKHYCPLPLDHPLYVQSADVKTSEAIAVGARAGDLVLWDSALVHANYAATSQSICGKLRRLVAYVAMAPMPSSLSENQLQKLRQQRLQAVAQGFTTSHWPNITPPSCYKKTFSEAEKALVMGQAPA